MWATNIAVARFLRRLYDPLRALVINCNCASCDCDCACNGFSTWFETGYNATHLHGRTAHKLDLDSYQITGGIQKTCCSELTLGLAGSYEYDNARYRDANGRRNSGYGSICGLYRSYTCYGLFDFVYGYSANRVRRTINVQSVRVCSKPNLNNFTFYGEAGVDLNCGCVLTQPFIGIQVGKTWRGKFSENAKHEWGLKINEHNWTTTRSRLGAHFSVCRFYDCVDASLDIAWNRLLSSRTNLAAGRFKEFGQPYTICGNSLDQNSVDYALNMATCLCNGLQGYIEVEGEWWQHASTVGVVGGVVYSW